MTISEPLRKRKEKYNAKRKALILKYARELLEEKGPQGVTIRELAARINYSLPTVYFHFRDKQSIIAELIQQKIKEIDIEDLKEQTLSWFLQSELPDCKLEIDSEYKTLNLISPYVQTEEEK